MRRFLASIYFVAALLFCGCEKPGPRALLEGERLTREGKYPEAIAQLETAAKLLPGHAQAWNHLGLAYQYAGKSDDAFRAYQQALRLDPNIPAVHFNLGNLYLEKNRLNEAITELTKATVLQPNWVEALLQLGKAQLRLKMVDDAERTFVQVLRIDKDNVEALNYYGVAQLHRRKARDAAAYFAAARKLDPTYAPAVLNEAVLYHHYIVNKTNALARYREYLSMKPDAAGAAAATESARVLEAELYPRPVAIATNALPQTNRVAAVATNQVKTNLAHAMKATNAPATNKIVATATEPKSAPAPAPAPVTNKIVASLPTPALTNLVFEKPAPPVITNALPPPPAPAPKTNIVLTVTNPPPIVENPVNPVHEKAKEKEPVKEAVKEPEPVKPLEVVKLDEEPVIIAPAKDIAPQKTAPPTNKPAAQVAVVPKTPEPPTNKVEEPPPLIRPVQREEKEKSSLLKKANPLNWFRRGEKEKEQEKPAEIVVKKPELPKPSKPVDLASLPEPPESKPTPAPPPEPVFARYPYRTTPLPPAGNRNAAMPAFNAAIQAHQEGKLGKAMDGYREAIRFDPRFMEAHLNLGIAAAAANDLSLALAAFEDAVRLDPKSAEARYQFAMALRRANYPQDAVNELRTLLENTPTEARAYLALGNLYAQVMNKPEAAATNYQKALDLDPKMPQAPQVRAWLAQH